MHYTLLILSPHTPWPSCMCALSQLHHAQVTSAELEKTLVDKIQEHDQQELQFHTEHEEEVRALYQQKQLLAKQMDDLKKHYHRLLNDQDNQVSIWIYFMACNNEYSNSETLSLNIDVMQVSSGNYT